MGYGIVATAGTKAALEAGGVADVEAVLKIQEGRPNAGDLMVNKDITMLMITTTGAGLWLRCHWEQQCNCLLGPATSQ